MEAQTPKEVLQVARNRVHFMDAFNATTALRMLGAMRKYVLHSVSIPVYVCTMDMSGAELCVCITFWCRIKFAGTPICLCMCVCLCTYTYMYEFSDLRISLSVRTRINMNSRFLHPCSLHMWTTIIASQKEVTLAAICICMHAHGPCIHTCVSTMHIYMRIYDAYIHAYLRCIYTCVSTQKATKAGRTRSRLKWTKPRIHVSIHGCTHTFISSRAHEKNSNKDCTWSHADQAQVDETLNDLLDVVKSHREDLDTRHISVVLHALVAFSQHNLSTGAWHV